MLRRTLLTIVSAIAVIWPFFQYPGSIFYNRYFEAATVFNPSWTLHSYFNGWSAMQHLGYPTLTEVVYLSFQTLVLWLLHTAAGTELTSKIYPALVQLWVLASFLVFARKKYPQLPYVVSLAAALFFTVNPITAAAIHEGYSGMLVDYALFPWTVLLVDYAFERKAAPLLAVIPLLYTITSMFKFPEVAINLAVLLVLRWREIAALLRSSRTAAVVVVLALCANLYWVLPIALNAATHRALPIQTDTQSEIAVTTHYSTISNVVLGRVFGAFGSDTNLCSGCGYYEGSYFNIAMLVLALAAYAGLIRGRRWDYAAVLTAAIVFATGYHYQDSLIGVPYQILMGLPTMQIFRAANVFSFIEFFCYAVGLLAFAQALRASGRVRTWHIAGGAIAVVLVGLPLLTGSILEHGNPPNAPFFVRIPEAYARARRVLPAGSNGVTLLVPNQGFAAYTWGAAVQDFLPAYVGRPSISNWYWPQPSASTQRVLDLVTNLNVPRANVVGAMRVMRVDSVFVHNDVVAARHINPSRYGRAVFSDGQVSIVLPPLAPAPMLQSAAGVLDAAPGSAAPVAGWTGDVTSVVRRRADCARAFALAPYKQDGGTALFAYDAAGCSHPLRITLFARSAAGAPALSVRMKQHEISLPLHPAGNRRWQTTALLPRATMISVRHAANVEALEFVPDDAGSPSAAQPLDIQFTLSAWGWAQIPVSARALVLNQSSDSSWQVVVWKRGHPYFAPKFLANGYANGWFVPDASRVLIVNFAQVAFLFGCLLSILSLTAGVVLAVVSMQRYSVRAELAAQD